MADYCHNGGYVVGARGALLEQADAPLTDSDVVSGKVLGCNNLVCTACGCAVKNVAGALWDPHPEPSDLERLYDSDAIESLTAKDERSVTYRAYACRCTTDHFFGTVDTHTLFEDGDLPWECGGHT